MNPATQAVILGRRRQQVTQTFTGNATWPAPTTTSRIDTASGYGRAGSPGTPSKTGWYRIVTTTYQRRDGQPQQDAVQEAPVFDGSPKPGNYCDAPVQTPDSTVYYSYVQCYSYFSTTQAGTPPTTGASTTAFGKTFPGGTGGPASTTTFSNVIVTPGASYNIVVPSGGSLTITYFK